MVNNNSTANTADLQSAEREDDGVPTVIRAVSGLVVTKSRRILVLVAARVTFHDCLSSFQRKCFKMRKKYK
jgi:hypothetical protein